MLTYRLVSRNRDGGSTTLGAVSLTVPAGLHLGPVFPNPGRGPMTATYRGDVAKAEVFDVQGRLVRSLEVPPGPAGVLVWRGLTRAGGPAAPGLYFLRVSGPEGARVRRLILTP